MVEAIPDRAVVPAKRIGAFDGLRGVSALMVVLYHVRNAPFSWLNGNLGVAIFFALSGYLITGILVREDGKDGKVDYGGFVLRRVARILPLYAVALVAYGTLSYLFLGSDRHRLFIDALPYYLLFFQEWAAFHNFDRPFAVSWSLGIEEKFYVVWPVLAFVVLRGVRSRIGLAVGLTAASFTIGVYWSHGVYVASYATILAGCFGALLLGRGGWPGLRSALERGWVADLALVATALLVARPLAVGNWRTIVLGLSVTAALPGLGAGVGVGAQTLSLRALRWAGERAYGLYLLHGLALGAGERLIADRPGALDDVLTLAIGLAILLPTVHVLHRYVEVPCIDWARRRTKDRRERKAAVA